LIARIPAQVQQDSPDATMWCENLPAERGQEGDKDEECQNDCTRRPQQRWASGVAAETDENKMLRSTARRRRTQVLQVMFYVQPEFSM